jgi:hypothetical protein
VLFRCWRWPSPTRALVLASPPVPLLRLAVPVLVSLAGIRLLARVFTLVFPHSRWRVWWSACSPGWPGWPRRCGSWGLLPAVLAEMDKIEFAFGKTHVSLRTILEGALSSGLVMVLVLWISAALERKVLRDAVSDLSLRKVAGNAIRAVLLVIGFLFALLGGGRGPHRAVRCWAARWASGLGLRLQKLAANYVSGFVILAERSPAHRRHGAGRQLRGRGGGHQDPLHADPARSSRREAIGARTRS